MAIAARMDAKADIAVLDEGGPLARYRTRLAGKALRPDAAQERVAARLDALWRELCEAPPPAPRAVSIPAAGLLGRLWRRRPVRSPASPRGLYLVGGVGRGKSMLMDLFFAAAPWPRKRRVHFHRFMQEAHRKVHTWRRSGHEGDPIPELADKVAAEAALLCFDEFQITDIADAMILGRLFEALFARGVVVVATSNTPPHLLFHGQPGYEALAPFLALLQSRLEVVEMEAGRDWRRQHWHAMPTWHVPADAAAAEALDAAFATLAGHARPHPRRLSVLGRTLAVEKAAGGVARFSFAALCQTALGPADYLTLAEEFSALVLDAIPRFTAFDADSARRFVVLIDSLYEHRVKLVASAAALPDQLLDGLHTEPAFARTASRLAEMQGEHYLALPHFT